MKKIVILLLMLSNPAIAYEEWHCTEYSYTKKVLVKAIDTDSKGIGTVEVLGEVYLASVYAAGFKKRWDFEQGDDFFKYTFTIDAKGKGLYYDFTTGKSGETTDASMVFNCKIVSRKAP